MDLNTLTPICLVIGLYAAWKSGSIFLKTDLLQTHRVLPSTTHAPVTLLLIVAIAVPSVLQFFFPEILITLRRDYVRFASGEWWRLVTPLFVQDAGIAGSIFNLVSLALVGTVAEQLWGRWRMLVIFFVGGIAGEIVAFSWQPLGAGNSVGNFSLAASVAVLCLLRRPSRVVQMAALLALSADLLLIIMKDIHGAAAITGVVLAISLCRGRLTTDAR
jgi:membrane associated rhomboid family serine protease